MIRTFDPRRIKAVECRLGAGRLVISLREELDAARVEVTCPDIPPDELEAAVSAELRDDVLTIRVPKSWLTPKAWLSLLGIPLVGGVQPPAHCLEITLAVPSGTSIKVAGYSVEAIAEGRTGTVDVAGGRAIVELDRVDGELRVRCGSGSVRAHGISATATVRGAAVDAWFGSLDGRLDVACSSGRIDVDVARGPLRLRTGAGEARIRAVHADVDFASGAGGLSLGVPAGVTAKLDVTTGAGRLTSDLPVTAQATREHKISIRARTGTGDVHLFRAAESA